MVDVLNPAASGAQATDPTAGVQAPDPSGGGAAASVANLTAAVHAAPELKNAPGAAMDVAMQGGNVPVAAQAVAAQGNRTTTALAADSVNAGTAGFLSHVAGLAGKGIQDVAHVGDFVLGKTLAHYAGDAVGDVAKAANIPLQTVQHEWRYLHDVEARHGMFAALAEGLAITGAVAAGTLLTGGAGDMILGAGLDLGTDAAGVGLGATQGVSGAADIGAAGVESSEGATADTEAAANAAKGPSTLSKMMNVSGGRGAVINGPMGPVMGHLMYQDSWDRTANGDTYTDPNTHQQVSFGRDVIGGWLHIDRKSGTYAALSGVTDALADLFGDPLQAALSGTVGAGKSLEGGQTIAGTSARGTVLTGDNFVATIEGKGIFSDNARRWLAETADADAGTIVSRDSRMDPIVGDTTVAADGDQQAQLSQYLASRAAIDDQLKFGKKVLAQTKTPTEGPVPEPDLTNVTDDVRTHLVRNRYANTLGAGDSGNLSGHLTNLRDASVPDLEAQLATVRQQIAAIPQTTIKGLASASTPDEVADVLMNRVVKNGEYIGSRIPSTSYGKMGMREIRNLAANADADQLHVARGLLNPKTLMGTLSNLTTRIPGELDVAKHAYTATVDLDNMKRMNNLVEYLQVGLNKDEAISGVNMLYDADRGGRYTILRNLMINNWIGATRSALRYDLHDENAVEDFLNSSMAHPAVKDYLQATLDRISPITAPDATGVFQTTRTGAPALPMVMPSGYEVSGAIRPEQAAHDIELPPMNDVRSAAKFMKYGHDYAGGINTWLLRNVTSKIKPVMLATVGYPFHMGASEMLMYLMRDGALNTVKQSWLAGAAKLGLEDSPTADDAIAGYAAALRDQIGDVSWRRLLRKTAAGDSTELQYHFMHMVNTEGHGIDESLSSKTFGLEDASDTLGVKQSVLHNKVGDNFNPDDMGARLRGIKRFGATTAPAMKQAETYTGLEAASAETGSADDLARQANSDYRRMLEWQSQLRQLGRNPADQAVAQTIIDAHAEGVPMDEVVRRATATSRAEIDKLDNDTLGHMAHAIYKVKGSPLTKSPLDDWADQHVENLLALTHKPLLDPEAVREVTGDPTLTAQHLAMDGGPHEQTVSLLRSIVNGQAPTEKVLRSVDVDNVPLSVPGHSLEPLTGHWFNRAVTVGFEHVMAPIVDSIARQPMAATEFARRMGLYQADVDKGYYTLDQSVIRAQTDTMIDMVRYIHNPADRTQLDIILGNWAPFFFAQNQAYRRAARLFVDDPGAFRRYQLAIMGASNLTSKMQDSAGNSYIAIPGASFLTRPIVDALTLLAGTSYGVNPTGFGGTLSSANVIFPTSQGERPDISPVVIVPLEALDGRMLSLGRDFPSLEPAANDVNNLTTAALGSEAMSESTLEQIVPNAVATKFVEAATGTGNSFHSALLLTLANLDVQQNEAYAKWAAAGSKGLPPDIFPADDATATVKEAFLAKVRTQTQARAMVNTIMALVSPIGSDLTVNDFGLRQDLTNDMNRYGTTDGYTHFAEKHPFATPFTVAESFLPGTNAGLTPQPGDNSVELPETVKAMNWVTAHLDQLVGPKGNPALLWLMPVTKGGAYSQASYLLQIADGLRDRDTPLQFLDALYVAQGDGVYDHYYGQYQTAVAAAGNNPQAKNAAYSQWSTVLNWMSGAYPTWYASYAGAQKGPNTINTIHGIETALQNGTAPKGPQTTDVENMLGWYKDYNAQYVAAGQSADYSTAEKAVVTKWQAFCATQAAAIPNLAPMITSVWKDALQNTNPGESGY